MFKDASTPAVLLVCYRHGGLGMVRSLGRAGVPVYVVHDKPMTAAFLSRYCKGRFFWDLESVTATESLCFLRHVARRIGSRPLLIPTSDFAAMFVADYAGELREFFVFPEQDPGLVRSLCSKERMYYLANTWNVPTPQTAFPRSRSELIKYMSAARFPLLLKPITRERAAWPIRIVHTGRELLEQYDSLENPAAPNLMVQEYIPGGDEQTWTFNGYFDSNGECHVAFTGRKLRNYPPYFGMASLGVCAHNERVANTTISFMNSIGYRGPLDIGYRFDSRDGQYKVNDINPRVGGMFRLFVGSNGMDVVRAMYQDLTDQHLTASSTPEGRKWVVEDCDWISALRYYRDGVLTARDWVESYRGINEMSYIARDDMWPVAGVLATKLVDNFSRARRLLSRTRAKVVWWTTTPRGT